MESGAWKQNRLLRSIRIAMLAGNAIALAQVQEGRIVGAVYDPQHSIVPGATVTVTDLATNVAKRVATDSAGDYVVTPLNPATYSVSATAPGFQTTLRSGIELVNYAGLG